MRLFAALPLLLLTAAAPSRPDQRLSAIVKPVSGAQMQLRDHVRLHATKLTKQELPEQRVVAIPPTPAVQRHQEHARRFQAAKPCTRS